MVCTAPCACSKKKHCIISLFECLLHSRLQLLRLLQIARLLILNIIVCQLCDKLNILKSHIYSQSCKVALTDELLQHPTQCVWHCDVSRDCKTHSLPEEALEFAA